MNDLLDDRGHPGRLQDGYPLIPFEQRAGMASLKADRRKMLDTVLPFCYISAQTVDDGCEYQPTVHFWKQTA